MNTSFADEKKLLLAEWRKHGISGEPSEADVILFAERRYNAAFRALLCEDVDTRARLAAQDARLQAMKASVKAVAA